MRQKPIIVFLVVLFIHVSFFCFAQNKEEKKEKLVVAESAEQLMKFIRSATKKDDIQRLKQIINLNVQLIREEKLLNIQLCGSFLNRAIKKELSGQTELGKYYSQISQALGEMYKYAAGNQYLLEKVAIFRKWNKEEKEKYLEAEKLFSKGEELRKGYKNDTAVDFYNRSISLFREIGYKEGEANNVKSLAVVHLNLSEYNRARSRYEDCLALYREIRDILGEVQSLRGLGYVHQMLNEPEQARERYEESLVLNREMRNRFGEANSLHCLGNVHYMLSKYEQARVRYEEALVIYRKIKYRLGEATSLRTLGKVHQMLDENVQARVRLEGSLEIYRKIGNRLGEANCLSDLGDFHYQFSNYAQARIRYEEALLLNREIKHRLGESNSLFRLGDVYMILSEYKQARNSYEESLMLYREIKERVGEAASLNNLGDVHMMLSEYEKARVRYEESLEINRKIGNRFGEANSLQSIGNVHYRLSEFEQALVRYEECLLIFREIKYRSGEVESLSVLGDVYLMLNMYEQARGRYEECLEFYREFKYRLGEANSLLRLGDIYLILSEYEHARVRYEEALVIYQEIKHRLGEGRSLQRIGDVHLGISKYEKALDFYEESYRLFREINNRFDEASCLKGLGYVYLMLNKYKKARRCFETGLAIQRKILDKNGILWSYYLLGRTFETQKKFPEAEENYIKSIEVLENIWEGIKVEKNKTAYLGSKLLPYERLINLLFNQGKGKTAFPYAERSKARSFLYLLGNKRVNPKEGVPLALVEEEVDLKQKITSKTLRIMEDEKNEESQQISSQRLRKELLQLKQKHFEIMEKIKRKSPEYASLLSINPQTAEDIQTLIHAEGNIILLEYYTTPEAIFLWILDGKQIHPYKIDITESELKSKIERYSSFVTKPSLGFNGLTNRAKDLYGFLLKPIEPLLKEKKYIGIIPHGALHYLPFETLITEKSLLLEKDVKIFYLPSASTYKYCKQKNKLNKTKIIALGNPDGTLRHSKKEVENIRDLFQPNAEIFIGEDAKESIIKDNKIASSSDIIHFACHGNFDSNNTVYSHLKLAPGDGEDGRLETQEIFNLHLKPAYLVTLSACQTHKGGLNPGDELIGLTRAFIYAGTSSVLASLWKVDDYYTEKFMVAFYRALKNSTKIEALHTARQTIIQEYGKKHPYYWAAFVLIGDPQ